LNTAQFLQETDLQCNGGGVEIKRKLVYREKAGADELVTV